MEGAKNPYDGVEFRSVPWARQWGEGVSAFMIAVRFESLSKVKL